METALLFALLCVLSCRGRCAKLDCDWVAEVEYGSRCCKACPLGYYPKEPCSEDKVSNCEKCSKTSKLSTMEECFCKERHICVKEECDVCEPRKKCPPGHQLKRYGAFSYTFVCEPCLANFYNDVEDGTCKPITRRVEDDEVFPGNQTHNATSASAVKSVEKALITGSSPHSLLLTCLSITVMICLLATMYAVFQLFKYKKLLESKTSCIHQMALPPEECSCKLSKEERGDKLESKSELFIEEDRFDVFLL